MILQTMNKHFSEQYAVNTRFDLLSLVLYKSIILTNESKQQIENDDNQVHDANDTPYGKRP